MQRAAALYIYFSLIHRFVRKGEAVATSCIFQSMKIICKLYEEWMEVMEDYATVFSSDNTARVPDIMSSEDPSKMVQSKFINRNAI